MNLMRFSWWCRLVPALAAPLVSGVAHVSSVQPADAPGKSGAVQVGIRAFEPCVILDEESGWVRGFEIEVWEEMARRADLDFEYVVGTFEDIVGKEGTPSRLVSGDIDVGFSGLTITADRLGQFDSCHSHLSTGLKIVSRKTLRFPFGKVAFALGAFLAVVVVYGVILWRLEHGNDLINDQFIPGVFDSMWCIMTTMSTVGYGAVCPRRPLGRLFTCWVMITGIGYFCAVMGGLTINAMMSKDACAFEELPELRGLTVAVKQNSTAQRIADGYTDVLIPTASAQDAVELVQQGRVDAALVDAPVIDNLVRNGAPVASSALHARQDYGIFLRKEDAALRHELNRALRTMIEDGTFNEIFSRWF